MEWHRANSLLWVGRLLLELLLRGVLRTGGGVGSGVLRLLGVLLDGLVRGGCWLASDRFELVLLGCSGGGAIVAAMADG